MENPGVFSYDKEQQKFYQILDSLALGFWFGENLWKSEGGLCLSACVQLPGYLPAFQKVHHKPN